jgi:hypothetical protein
MRSTKICQNAKSNLIELERLANYELCLKKFRFEKRGELEKKHRVVT